jgi:hypothetical protein
LERIQIDSPKLAALSTQLGIGSTDYECYLGEERAYLAALRHERHNVKETADYMDLLFELHELQYVDSYLPLNTTMLINAFHWQTQE